MESHHLTTADCPDCGSQTVWSDGNSEWCKSCGWSGDILKEREDS